MRTFCTAIKARPGVAVDPGMRTVLVPAAADDYGCSCREIDDIMRVSKLRVGDGPVIWRTSLTSGDTILTWTRVGMVSVDRRGGPVLWILRHRTAAELQLL